MSNDQTSCMSSFQSRLEDGIKESKLYNYVYKYPSKRAYRRFPDPIKIDNIWHNNTQDVNIYIHVPFCRQRCAYCTLFTTTKHTPELIETYVEKICEQIKFYSRYAEGRLLTSIYFGGGTPTTLSIAQFERIFGTINRYYKKKSDDIETNVEGTPSDFTLPMLQALKSFGVNRISIGVQTLNPDEIKKTGRKSNVVVLDTLENIRSLYSNFNVDLIYGLPAQTRESWFMTLKKILEYHPSVLSLFPVVVRPSSKIKASQNKSDDYYLSDKEKYDIYDENLALVNKHGYKQDCFTRFCSSDIDSFFQETMEFKGMPLIGIGPGARSYKDRYHYSTDYVVSNEESYEVVKRFMEQEFNDETTTDNGIILDEDEQKRRFVILNLSLYGIDASLYKEKFASSPFERFGPEFKILRDNKCIAVDDRDNVKLTPLGYKFSPLLAQLFFSEKMKALELDL